MLLGLIVRFIVNGVAVIVSAWLLAGVTLENAVTPWVAALVIGLINTFIRPIIMLLALPLRVITLGLISLVINALLILLAAAIVPGFTVANFWWALLFSIVLTIVGRILDAPFGTKPKHKEAKKAAPAEPTKESQPDQESTDKT